MSLLQMSISGGAMAAAVLLVRALALHRLPKRLFPALWAIVMVRLLVPFSLPASCSVYPPPHKHTSLSVCFGGRNY